MSRTSRTSSSLFSKQAAMHGFLESLAKSFNNPESSPDLKIKCKGTEFLCHKHMLIRQSEWFLKACTGSFKESKLDTIELQDDHKDAVGAMLEFCHGLDYTNQPLPAFHVRVFAMAEKYLVPGLAELATDRFFAAGAATSETSLQDITDAIAESYTTVYDQGRILRNAITDLVILNSATLLHSKCPDFDDLMDSHPSLPADVARTMARTWTKPSVEHKYFVNSSGEVEENPYFATPDCGPLGGQKGYGDQYSGFFGDAGFRSG